MEVQQEIGGAQALLQLGSKLKDGEDDHELNISEIDESRNNEIIDDGDDSVVRDQTGDNDRLQSEDDDSKTTNQQINDAVEAAVMRYVGGTLDTNGSRKNKRRINHEEIMNNINDFNQWTGFLDEDVTNDDYSYASDITGKQRNSKRRRVSQDIDPELAGLGTSEHDQLVEAAIIDARELTRHINNGDLNDHDALQNTLNGVPPHQAQQVLAAANAAVQNQGHGSDSISAITQLAQAASSLSGSSKKTKTTPRSKKELKRIEESLINYATGVSEVQISDKGIPKTNFSHLHDVETLIEEASSRACTWYNSLGDNAGKGPRLFAPIEISAVDHFISGYCHLFKWTRDDICNRIWSSERKKDNFWESLTRVLPYRSRASIYKHVRRSYHIFEIRGKWTKEDDEFLRRLAADHEGKWKKIGEAMGRMPEDCRDRWRNYVKCGDQRTSQKWTPEEEHALKEIVTEMVSNATGKDKQSAVNWTLVSDRMNGRRSRIQCRYKWSKLVRRESMLRSTYMSSEVKSWLLKRLEILGFDSIEKIDWNYISQVYHTEQKDLFPEPNYDWDATDFKTAFEKMKTEVKDHRKLSLHVLLQKLANDYFKKEPKVIAATVVDERLLQNPPEMKASELTKTTTEKQYGHDKQHEHNVDGNDAASLANAAVAAISSTVDVEEPQQQEYSLWR